MAKVIVHRPRFGSRMHGGHFWGSEYGMPIRPRRFRNQFYVCPHTGTLRHVPQPRREEKESPPPAFPVDGTHVCRVIDGRWCLVTVRPLRPVGVLATSL